MTDNKFNNPYYNPLNSDSVENQVSSPQSIQHESENSAETLPVAEVNLSSQNTTGFNEVSSDSPDQAEYNKSDATLEYCEFSPDNEPVCYSETLGDNNCVKAAPSDDIALSGCTQPEAPAFDKAQVNQPQVAPPYQKPIENIPPQQRYQPPYSYEWYGKNENTANANNVNRPYYTNPAPQPKRKESKGVSKGMFFAGLAVCLCLSFIAGFAGTVIGDMFSNNSTTTKNGVTINRVESQNGDSAYYDSGLSTVEIVNKTADSVVEITTETVKTGVFAQQFIQSGAGSGVIIDTQGYIVTNHHVIDGATKISVTLRDGTAYDATLVGSDSELDVALLEITPDKALVAANFGDSNNLMVGQRTVAIGNPLGQLGGSVTEGIISALNRDVVIDGQTMSLLQTDTAINPGNSGGGLFDSNGNLIGIVNAKSSGSEVEGLGFAIPINDVIDVIGDLSEYGYVRGRVDLGITFIDVESEQVAWMYGLSKTGCYVYSVDTNCNADVAGLASGDRVVSVNGEAIESSDDIEAIIKDCSVGEEVTFSVENTKGKSYKVSFKLEEYVPEEENENFFESGGSPDDNSYWWSDFFG